MFRFKEKLVMIHVVIGLILFGTIPLNAYAVSKIINVVEFESAMYPPSPFKIKMAKELGIALKAKPGILLKGSLAKPSGDGPFPAVVLMHGCNGIWKWDEVWTNRLVAWGYVVLGVDSLEARGNPNTCIEPFAVSPATRSLDAYGAKIYLSTLLFVDPVRIAVMGMSHGGWSALKAIKRSTSADLQRKPFRAAVALYPYCGDTEQIVDIPTLILIGEKDEWTPANLCIRYLDTLQSPHETTLKVFPGAHHVFDLEGFDSQLKGVIDGELKNRVYRYDPEASKKAIQMIREFLKRWL